MKLIPILLFLATVVSIASCSIKEDRSGCPCVLTIDASDIRADEISIICSNTSQLLKTVLIPIETGPILEINVPRGHVNVATYTGNEFSKDQNDTLVIPYGKEADCIYANACQINTDAETAYTRIALNKQFARISLEFAKYDDYRLLMLFNVGFTPQYRYARDRWNIGAGIRFSKAFVQETAMPGVAPSGVNATGWIFPAVDVSFEAVRGYLWLNAAVDGGNAVNLYSDAVGRYPYLYPSGNAGTAFTDFTVIPYRMSFSIAGNVKSRFSYDLYLRYGKVEGLPAFAMDGDCPYLTYTLSSGLFTAGASLSWKSERVEAHAGVEYDDYSVTSADRRELLPPAFKGSASVEYNWRKRFFISVGADFAGEWGSVAYKVPGWVDLHVGAEYCFSKKFSVFLSAGNLLNDSIQFQPLQALPGINFMAGVCLKL